MKISKIPSRSSLLSVVLALTLGLSTTALASDTDPTNGQEASHFCDGLWGHATRDWAVCVRTECERIHDHDSNKVDQCLENAEKTTDETDEPAASD